MNSTFFDILIYGDIYILRPHDNYVSKYTTPAFVSLLQSETIKATSDSLSWGTSEYVDFFKSIEGIETPLDLIKKMSSFECKLDNKLAVEFKLRFL